MGLQLGILDAGQAADLFIQLSVILGLDQGLELVADDLPVRDPHCADLNDLAANLHRQHPFGRIGAGPGLIPFHVQDNILHTCRLSFSHDAIISHVGGNCK